ADVDAFYARNKDRVVGTKEQIAPRIKEYLAQQRRQQALDDYTATLRAKYVVKVLLEPLRATVDSKDAPARGAAGVPITLVEFGDFQCPYCRALEPTLEQVLKSYSSKVRLVFRQFPLPTHSEAAKAAEASLCAREQNKFWELHDRMYSRQEALKVDALKAAAGQLGMDAERFGRCLDSGKYEAAVKADLAAGDQAGVTGPPALFVNGPPEPGAAAVVEQRPALTGDDAARREQVERRDVHEQVAVGVRRRQVAVVDLAAGELERALAVRHLGWSRGLGQRRDTLETVLRDHLVDLAAQHHPGLLVREDRAAGAADELVRTRLLAVPMRVDQQADSIVARRGVDRAQQRVGARGRAAVDHQRAVVAVHREHVAARDLEQREAAE